MIDTQEEFDAFVRARSGARCLAIDCEMDAMFAYRTRLCVVQVGWPGGEVLIDGMVDLDRSGLGDLFADPAVLKVFHGGENDVGLMRAHWGFEFSHLFDTMTASQVLGQSPAGLAAVLQRHFDVKLAKKYQRADWRVRPLPEEQAEYARMDVRWLLPLQEKLQAELERMDRLAEAESDFRRLEQVWVDDKPFNPESWGKVKGSREIEPEQRALLRELYIARDEIARGLDWAPYRVMHDSTLLSLMRQQPRHQRAVRGMKGVSRRLGGPELDRLLRAIREGCQQGVIQRPKPMRPFEAARVAGKALTDDEQVVFDALRAWRSGRAERRGVDVSRVATNALLGWIARARPTSVDELAAVNGMEPWRLQEYGEDIADVVRQSLP